MRKIIYDIIVYYRRSSVLTFLVFFIHLKLAIVAMQLWQFWQCQLQMKEKYRNTEPKHTEMG